MRPRRTTAGAFPLTVAPQGSCDCAWRSPHEILDFIGTGSILAIEYFQLLNGNWFGGGSSHVNVCVG